MDLVSWIRFRRPAWGTYLQVRSTYPFDVSDVFQLGLENHFGCRCFWCIDYLYSVYDLHFELLVLILGILRLELTKKISVNEFHFESGPAI